MRHLASKYSRYSFSTSSLSVPLRAMGSNECPGTEDHMDTQSRTAMTNRPAQRDLELIELALRRLLSNDKSHDPHGQDAESKHNSDEKDRDLLLRLLDQLNSLKAERGQKDCEISLATDDRNSDTELHGSDEIGRQVKNEIGGQVKNEEVMEEIRKVKKQNKLTHLLLGFIVASNMVWRISELAAALLIRKQISNPFRLIGGMITGNFGNFRGSITQNHSSHNYRASLLPRDETSAIPHFEALQLPHIEVPSFFQTEDRALHFSNGKLVNESSAQAQEKISLSDLLLQNPSSYTSD